MKILAISDQTTLKLLHESFGLTRNPAPDFCNELTTNLIAISESQQKSLARIRDRYFYQLEEGMILEEGVKMMIVSPLLDLAGFYDPPFRTKFEPFVQLTTYGLSKQFSILNPGELEQVLQILVRLGQLGLQ